METNLSSPSIVPTNYHSLRSLRSTANLIDKLSIQFLLFLAVDEAEGGHI